MAKYLPLPKSLNEADKTLISDVITATEHQFKGDLFGETNAPLTESYVTPDGRYYWSSNGELRTYVTNLTNTNDVRSANGVLYKTLSAAPEYSEPTTAGAPEQVDSNSVSVSTGSLEQFEKEKEIRSAAKAQADLKAKQDVEASIKRQLEIHTQEIQKAKVAEARLKVENKKIYYKAEAQEKAFLTTKQMQALETLKQQANSAPEETFKQIKQSIQNKVQGVPEGAADKAAYDILEDLRSDSETAAKDAAFREMSSKPELFGKEEELFAWTKELSNEKANRLALDQKLAEATFGKEFASNIVPKYKIQISETPEPGFNRRINFEEIPQQRISTLNDRSSFLQSFSGNFVKSEVESRAYSFIGEKIEQQVLNMVAKGTISEGAGSLINTALSVFGATAPMEWVAVEGSIVGEFAMATGMGPTFGFLGQVTGSSFFGVTEAAAATAATTTATVGSVGTTLTVGGLGGAAVATTTTAAGATVAATTTVAAETAGAAAGLAGGPLALITVPLGILVGKITGEIAKKIPWHKIKDFVIAVPGGILGVVVGGVYGGVVGYTGAFMLSRFLGGGFPAMQSSLSSFGSGVINVMSVIGSTFMEGVGKPILATFLIFPLVVALILFIINSGAYVVPPGTGPGSPFHNGGGGGNITCTTEKGPVIDTKTDGIGPESSSPTANRAWEIAYDLYQGFWCFWNRPPTAPSPWNDPNHKPINFPNDVVKYGPDYHQNFDYQLFSTNPNGDESSYQGCSPYTCLFWCTQIIAYSYKETGQEVPTDSEGHWILGAASMQSWFTSKGRFISATVATPDNVKPGSVVFFSVRGGTDHVGETYSVSQDSLIYVQSNAPTKSGSITFNKNGIGVQNIGDIIVVGFSKP